MTDHTYDGGGGITLEELEAQSRDPGYYNFDDVQVIDFQAEPAQPEPELITPDTVLCNPDKPRIPLNKSQPLQWARIFMDECFAHSDRTTLLKWRDDIYVWSSGAWRKCSKDQLSKYIYLWGDVQIMADDKPFNPNASKVKEITLASTALSSISDDVHQPSLLGPLDINPEMAVAVQNGIVDLRNSQLIPPSPLFFSGSCVKLDYNEFALRPREWLKFLNDVWGDDPESIDTLQEIFGYLLTSMTSMQKAFMIIGPKRSGKGTIARMLGEIVGMDAIVAPTLASISTNFGMAPLIGKKVALVADARLSGRTDTAVVAERILSVTGEDIQSIDRKNQSAWNGKLVSRFIIMSNILPRFMDASGALTSRMIILKMKKSFYGNEDANLFSKLKPELPGIFLWALEGLQRLRERGHFIQPSSSLEMVSDLNDLASNVSKFVREECEIGDETYKVERGFLYEEWKLWCENNGIKPGNTTTFKAELTAAFPHITDDRKSVSSKRKWFYIGIQLAQKEPEY